MMASSKQAITHHLVVLFFSCLKNQENQPIIYTDATPVLAHTHAHTNTYMYTCEMHLHMRRDMNNFNHTTLHLRHAFSPDRQQKCDVITTLRGLLLASAL